MNPNYNQYGNYPPQPGRGFPQQTPLGNQPYQPGYSPQTGAYPQQSLSGAFGGATRSYTTDTMQMQDYFRRIAGADQTLDRHEFCVLYSQLHPETIRNPHFYQMADNAFMAADTNGSGRISFNEFMNAYQRLRAYY